jgi:hypothetical protein
MAYHHTQRGTIIVGGAAVALFFIFFSLWDTEQPDPVKLGVLAVLALALVLFNSLTVEVKNNSLVCRFGVGLIQKKFPLSEIKGVCVVQNPWYSGWGIRWRPGRYVLWSVSGFQAVELALKDGNRFRIGTDEPEELLNAIRNHNTIGT